MSSPVEEAAVYQEVQLCQEELRRYRGFLAVVISESSIAKAHNEIHRLKELWAIVSSGVESAGYWL